MSLYDILHPSVDPILNVAILSTSVFILAEIGRAHV